MQKDDKNEYYYNVKETSRSYQKVFLDPKDVVTLNRKYAEAKSFPLKRVIDTLPSPGKTPMHPHAAVVYIVTSVIKEISTIKPHGNCTKNTSKQKPYIAPLRFAKSGEKAHNCLRSIKQEIWRTLHFFLAKQ